MELHVGKLLGTLIGPCCTWVIVQLLPHSTMAINALHGEEEAHTWSVVHWGWRGAHAKSSFGLCCFPSDGDLSLSVVGLCVFMGGFLFQA